MITFTTMSLPHSFFLLFLLLFILFLGVRTPKFIDLLLPPLPHSSSSYSSSSSVVVVVEFVRIGNMIWVNENKRKKKQPDVYLTVILLLVNYDQIHARLNLENGSTMTLSWSQKSISDSWWRSRRTLCGINDIFTYEPTCGSLYDVICGSLCVPICDFLI